MGNAPAARPTTSGKFKRGFCLVPDRPDAYSDHKRYDKFRDLPEVRYPVNTIAVAEVALMLAAATMGTQDEVHLWDLVTKELKVSLHAHSAHVWDLAFSPNESTLATASNDHTIRLWDTYTGEPKGVLKGHSEGVRTLSFSSAGYLVTGGIDSLLCLWEYDNPEPLQRWQAHEGDVHCVRFSPADPFAAFSVGADGSIAFWNAMDGEEGLITRFPGGMGGGLLSVAPHPLELGVVAVGHQDGGVWLWHFDPNTSDGDPHSSSQQLRGHKGPVWTVAFSKDGCLMASGSSDASIRVWMVTNLRAPILVATLPAHDTWVRQIVYAHDSFVQRDLPMPNRIVSCSVDGTVREWILPKSLRTLQRDGGSSRGSKNSTTLPEVHLSESMDRPSSREKSEEPSLVTPPPVQSLAIVETAPPPPPPPKSMLQSAKTWGGPAPAREVSEGVVSQPWPPPPPPGAALRVGRPLPPPFIPKNARDPNGPSLLPPQTVSVHAPAPSRPALPGMISLPPPPPPPPNKQGTA